MREKTIGILGGMGSEATLALFKEIIERKPATKDQDHIRVIIDSNAKIPDRTQAILGKGECPMPEMTKSYKSLERAGADCIIIPCVSAHVFLVELRRESEVPILSVFDEVADQISLRYPYIETVGLLATQGTIEGGLFQKKLAERGIKTITPDSASLSRVMAAIYTLKGANTEEVYTDSRKEFRQAAQLLVDRNAQGIIAGCTEIPLAFEQRDITVPLLNPLSILADSAIREANPNENICVM